MGKRVGKMVGHRVGGVVMRYDLTREWTGGKSVQSDRQGVESRQEGRSEGRYKSR